jgi:SAM-dependent methyltransferase
MSAHSSAYDDDLAYIHDVGYDFHARGLAPSLVAMLKEARLAGSVVVDLGCGSGIWAEQLSQAGFRAVGVDLSPAMIARAKRRAPAGEFHVASFLDFDLPPCGAITALGEVLCYQFDRANNRRALARLFRRAYDALMPGGLFIFDIVELGLDRGRAPTWRAGDDWACLVAYEYDERRMQLARHITTFRKAGDDYRRGHETHRVQLYDSREIAGLLRQAGFRVRTVRRFGDYELRPMCAGFIARKAAV